MHLAANTLYLSRAPLQLASLLSVGTGVDGIAVDPNDPTIVIFALSNGSSIPVNFSCEHLLGLLGVGDLVGFVGWVAPAELITLLSA
jgi:hypothetical protein